MPLHATYVDVFLLWILPLLVNPEQYNNQVNQLCNILEYRVTKVGVPEVPDFLLNPTNTDLCRDQDPEGRPQRKCGEDFILTRCICTYHHVANEKYHDYTACSNNERADSIQHMTCEQCREYSVNNAGPCLNGGKINCNSDDLASDISCSCPRTFSGRFCEYQNISVYRKCQSSAKVSHLPVCDNTTGECQISLGDTVFKCSDYSKERKFYLCGPNPEYNKTNHAPAHMTNSCSKVDKTFKALVTSIFLQHLLYGSLS